jgi:hypothetical protein
MIAEQVVSKNLFDHVFSFFKQVTVCSPSMGTTDLFISSSHGFYETIISEVAQHGIAFWIPGHGKKTISFFVVKGDSHSVFVIFFGVRNAITITPRSKILGQQIVCVLCS